jgi:hypothetical protein
MSDHTITVKFEVAGANVTSNLKPGDCGCGCSEQSGELPPITAAQTYVAAETTAQFTTGRIVDVSPYGRTSTTCGGANIRIIGYAPKDLDTNCGNNGWPDTLKFKCFAKVENIPEGVPSGAGTINNIDTSDGYYMFKGNVCPCCDNSGTPIGAGYRYIGVWAVWTNCTKYIRFITTIWLDCEEL